MPHPALGQKFVLEHHKKWHIITLLNLLKFTKLQYYLPPYRDSGEYLQFSVNTEKIGESLFTSSSV